MSIQTHRYDFLQTFGHFSSISHGGQSTLVQVLANFSSDISTGELIENFRSHNQVLGIFICWLFSIIQSF